MAEALGTPPTGPAPALETIIDRICAHYGTSVDALGSPARARRLSRARGMVGWLARHTGAASLTEVAGRFHRDVATLSQAVRRRDLAAQAGKAISDQ